MDLYPVSGKIIVDDFVIDGENNINNLNMAKLSCICPTKCLLKDSSFIDNIVFDIDNKNLNLERIYEVSRIAKIKSFIEKQIKVFILMLGERVSVEDKFKGLL